MPQSETLAPSSNGKSKRGRRTGSKGKSNQYPGLEDNIRKLFEDNPGTQFSPKTIFNEHFPETSKFAVNYYCGLLTKKRILRQPGRGAYVLASASHRAKTDDAPLAVATPVRPPRVTETEVVVSDSYTREHLRRIEQRLQDAHELDIALLRRLAQ